MWGKKTPQTCWLIDEKPQKIVEDIVGDKT